MEAYGELSMGSSADFESSSSISRIAPSSLEISAEETGDSCIIGFPGTARPVANENFESAPIPTSEVAAEGRRLRPSLYQLLRLPLEWDRLRFVHRSPSVDGPSMQLSGLSVCDLGGPSCRL